MQYRSSESRFLVFTTSPAPLQANSGDLCHFHAVSKGEKVEPDFGVCISRQGIPTHPLQPVPVYIGDELLDVPCPYPTVHEMFLPVMYH
jgi:hypothetical protein